VKYVQETRCAQRIAFTNADRTEIWIAASSGADAKRLVAAQNHS
jgi:hypothetical protein